MLVRFGFVAMSVILENASPSKTVTFKTYRKFAEDDKQIAIEKIKLVARENLLNSLRLLRYCKAHSVEIYRFSSRLIPLATHPELKDWDYIKDLEPELTKLGDFIKGNKIRVSFHPDHFTLINSPREEVFESSVMDLIHHCRILNAMNLDKRAKLVIHVGGGYKNKEESLKRFIENWSRIPKDISERITLENDDKTFTAEETLYLCEKLKLPMVLDVHHFQSNHERGSRLDEIYSRSVSTWKGSGLPPKVHLSSPKSDADYRSHHDFIDPETAYNFLKIARGQNTDLDVMVEAKQKDKAMFQLVQKLGKKQDIQVITDACIEVF